MTTDTLKGRGYTRGSRRILRRLRCIEQLESRRFLTGIALTTHSLLADPTLDGPVGEPFSVVAADLSGDGRNDLVVATESELGWYENRDGQLANYRTIERVRNRGAVTAGDIDGDGDVDLLVSSSHLVFENRGGGDFNRGLRVPSSGTTATPALGSVLQGDTQQIVDVFPSYRGKTYFANVGLTRYVSSENPVERIRLRTDIQGEGSVRVDFDVLSLDVDDDGDNDLVYPSATHNRISWFENTGDEFSETKPIPGTTIAPEAIVAVDIDADDDVDLIGIEDVPQGEPNLVVFRKQAGSFTSEVLVRNFYAEKLVPTDFNGDGHLDFVAQAGDELQLLQNDTSTGWQVTNIASLANELSAWSIIESGMGTLQIGLADSYRDQIAAVTINLDGSVRARQQVSESISDRPHALLEIDVNKDSTLDTVFFLDDGTMVWLPTARNGMAMRPRPLASGSAPVESAIAVDFRDNGRPDVIGWDKAASAIHWYRYDADRSFVVEAPIELRDATVNDVQAADLDDDGDIDLVAGVDGEASLIWLENDGTQNFTQHIILGTDHAAVETVQLVDSNPDTLPDLVVYDADRHAHWLLNLERGGFFLPVRLTREFEFQNGDVATGDVDGDGLTDVLLRAEDGLTYWYRNRNSTFAPGIAIGDYDSIIEMVDIDHDDDLDLLIDGGTSLYWSANSGGGRFGPQLLLQSFDDSITSTVVDAEDDATTRITVAIAGHDSIQQVAVTAADVWTGPVVVDPDTHMEVTDLQLADVDLDGDVDAVTIAPEFGLRIYQNDGAGRFELDAIIQFATTNEPFVRFVDVDGDADFDIVTHRNDDDGGIVWLRNEGGKFEEAGIVHAMESRGSNRSFAEPIDIDQDGDTDLITGGRTHHSGCFCAFQWNENLGDGMFQPHVLYEPYRGLYSIELADFDQDGLLDIIGKNGRRTLAWSRNLGDGDFAAIENIRDRARAFHIFDWDRNGFPDVISDRSLVLSWIDEREFRPIGEFPNAWSIAQVVLTQLDEDDDPDLLMVRNGLQTAPVGSESEEHVVSFGTHESGFSATAVADLDGDGDQDVMTFAPVSLIKGHGGLVWYRNESIRPAAVDYVVDGMLDVRDVDAICAGISSDRFDARFDRNQDGRLDRQDVMNLLSTEFGTRTGDLNLDGQFDSGDLVEAFGRGSFESDEPASWSAGDWNCDGRFTSSDVVYAFQLGYDGPARSLG